MKTTLPVVFALLAMINCSPLRALEHNADSLRQAMRAADDTTRFRINLELTELYIRKHQNPDSSSKYTQAALGIAESLNDDHRRAIAIRYLGVEAKNRNDYDSAQVCYSRALNLFTQLGDSAWVAKTIHSSAIAHVKTGETARALELGLREAAIWEKIGNGKDLGNCYNLIGILFSQLRNPDRAFEYKRKAIRLMSEYGEPHRFGTTLANMAMEFGKNRQMDSCAFYADSALRIGRRYDLHINICQALNILAGTALIQEDYQKVLALTDSVIQRANPEMDKKVLGSTLYKRSDALVALGRLDEAVLASRQSLKLARKTKYLPSLISALERTYDYERMAGNYEVALRDVEELVVLRDSLYNEQNMAVINEMEARFESEKQERTILQLSNNLLAEEARVSARNNWLLILGLAATLLLALIFVLYQRQLRRKEKKVNEVRQRLLRAQLNPHFFFNALSSIQTLTLREKDEQKAARYLGRFARLMRQILDGSSEPLVSLEEEIDTLENYLELQKLRFDNGFDYRIVYDPELMTESILVPPMIAQPLVENALEHGARRAADGGEVTIHIRQNKEEIEMEITDNGPGLVPAAVSSGEEETPEHRSRALEIIRSRLQLIKGAKRDLDLVRIENRYNDLEQIIGAVARVRLPLILA